MAKIIEVEARFESSIKQIGLVVDKITAFGPETHLRSWVSCGSDDDTFVVLEPYESLRAKILDALKP